MSANAPVKLSVYRYDPDTDSRPAMRDYVVEG